MDGQRYGLDEKRAWFLPGQLINDQRFQHVIL